MTQRTEPTPERIRNAVVSGHALSRRAMCGNDTAAIGEHPGAGSIFLIDGMIDATAGQGARLPSQRRFKAREAALADGIALSAAELAQLAPFEAEGLDAVTA